MASHSSIPAWIIPIACTHGLEGLFKGLSFFHPDCEGGSWSVGPWVRKIPWRRECQPTPVIFPGEFHGQKGLVGYGPWSRKELGLAE